HPPAAGDVETRAVLGRGFTLVGLPAPGLMARAGLRSLSSGQANSNLKKRRFRACLKPFSRSTRVAFGAVFRIQKTTHRRFAPGKRHSVVFRAFGAGVFMVC